MLRPSGKAFLIVAALLICGAKLHSQRSVTPMAATQELNRCLAFVRAAASRRGSAAPATAQRRKRANAADRRPAVNVSQEDCALQPH